MTTWPPPSGVTSKVVPRENAVLQITYSTTIHAPALVVFETILHIADYAEWNTWIPHARILSQPPSPSPDIDPNDLSHMRVGTVMDFGTVMNADKPDKQFHTTLKVLDISTPNAPTSYLSPEMLEDATFTADLTKVYRVSWTGSGGIHSLGLNIERFHEVIIKGPNECELRNWEVMGGVLAHPVKWTHGSVLPDKAALWCEDLKKRCETKRASAE